MSLLLFYRSILLFSGFFNLKVILYMYEAEITQNTVHDWARLVRNVMVVTSWKKANVFKLAACRLFLICLNIL